MKHAEGASNGDANGSGVTAANTKVTLEDLAVSPNLPGQVPGLLEEIASSGREYLTANTNSRLSLLEAARSLVYALETPREAIIRHCWSDVRPLSCFTFAIDSTSPNCLTVYQVCGA